MAMISPMITITIISSNRVIFFFSMLF